jgi:Tfp pilus assembly protein PilO
MSTEGNNMKENKPNVILGLLLTVVIGLAGWNISATHELSKQVAALSQKVQDGKELRLEYMSKTDARLQDFSVQISRLCERIAALEVKINHSTTKVQ